MKNKKQSGITLVALVVTIVVLLILAGVSINLVLGENGLITQAKEAKEKSASGMNEENYLINSAIPDYIDAQVNEVTGNAKTITADDYGKVVTNYQDGHTWEIFYADNQNVYLITRDNVGSQTLSTAVADNSGYNGTSDFDGSDDFKTKYPAVQAGWLNKTYTPAASGAGTVNYTSSYDNMKATEYLLDSTVWNTTYKTEKADWAIGAPTLELFVASYNKIYTEKTIEIAIPNETGYKYNDKLYPTGSITTNDDMTSGTSKSNIFNHGYYYWLACPGSGSDTYILFVSSNDNSVGPSKYSSLNGTRPVVCLKSDVILKKSSDGNTFTIN